MKREKIRKRKERPEGDEAKKQPTFQIRPFKTKLAAGMTVKKLEQLIREV